MTTTEGDPVATRDEILAALHHANATAKREQRIVGTPEHPTRWDKAHRYLNQLLYELQMVGR